MKYEAATILIAFFGLSVAAPAPRNVFVPPTPARQLRGREVPQEHSHEKFLASVRTSLALNNPDNIGDPVFGLLGNTAAAAGQGKITDTDCLHQATADQAFTNAKAAGDVAGMVGALQYAAIERNTGKVGLKSVSCTAIKAKNPEIQAVQQHQDPASAGAAATNKAITLELARQIAAVGGDPQLALEAGTFAPGDVNDPTGKGNTCDTLDDPIGCIFTQNLLVEDATAAEITAAVAGAQTGGNNGANTGANNGANNGAANGATNGKNGKKGTKAQAQAQAPATTPAPVVAADAACPAQVTQTVTVTQDAAPTPAVPATQAATKNNNKNNNVNAAATGNNVNAAATGNNVQTFTGTLGGAAPPVIQSSGTRPFSVNGNTFVNIGAALQRSCAIQNNACANAANSGQLAGGVGQCNAQETACNAAAN